jgi:hypothetical protein
MTTRPVTIRCVEKEEPMADDLRTCATGCCNFIGDESLSREQYEKALGTGPSGGMVETKIPCREALTPAQDAVETAAGFYLGHRVRSGSPLPAGGNSPVFEKGTNKYLGDANPEHYKKWRDETRRTRQATGE